MSTHRPSETVPAVLHWRRFCKNRMPVNGQLARQLADQYNHILAYRRKYWLFRPTVATEIPSPTGGTQTWHYFAGHTGHGIDRLVCYLVMAKPTDGGATDPRADFQVTPGLSGGTTITSTDTHTGITLSTNDYPDEFHHARIYASVSSDTLYRGIVRTHDYARIAGCLIYEVATNPVDTSDGGLDPRLGAGTQILDDHLKNLNEGLTDIWRHNAGPLFTWSMKYGDSITHSGTSYTNPFDSTTTVTSASVGVTLNLQYHNTVAQTTVPVKIVIACVRTSGSGDIEQNVVRFTDGTNSIDINGIDSSTRWYQTTGNIDPDQDQKWDIHMKTASGDTLRLEGFTIFEYQV